jgi:hypothetical protein
VLKATLVSYKEKVAMLETLNSDNQHNLDLLQKDVENRDVLLLTSGFIKQDHDDDKED